MTNILVWLGLMVLLGLTVLAWKMHLGVTVALLIAAAKAALVIVFFMHLRVETPRTRFLAGGVLFWLLLLYGLTLTDYFSRM